MIPNVLQENYEIVSASVVSTESARSARDEYRRGHERGWKGGAGLAAPMHIEEDAGRTKNVRRVVRRSAVQGS